MQVTTKKKEHLPIISYYLTMTDYECSLLHVFYVVNLNYEINKRKCTLEKTTTQVNLILLHTCTFMYIHAVCE